MTAFYDLVSAWERTNRKDPVQVKGLLVDGRSFEFVHDGEQAMLALPDTIIGPIQHHADNGYIDEDTFKDLLLQLLATDQATDGT